MRPDMCTFLSVTILHVILCLCVVHEIIAFSSRTHTNYLQDTTWNYLPHTKALGNKVLDYGTCNILRGPNLKIFQTLRYNRILPSTVNQEIHA